MAESLEVNDGLGNFPITPCLLWCVYFQICGNRTFSCWHSDRLASPVIDHIYRVKFTSFSHHTGGGYSTSIERAELSTLEVSFYELYDFVSCTEYHMQVIGVF